VSKHLACLRDCGLVTSEPAGRASVFRLAQPALAEMLTAAETVLAATGNAVALCPGWGIDACGGEPSRPPPAPRREQGIPILDACCPPGSPCTEPETPAVRDAGRRRAARLARQRRAAWPISQGALIVRPSGAEVPMGSLLSVIAVTVTANAPTPLEGAAVKVRTERPPMTVVGGENDAVTPLGRPLTLRATGAP